jgi:serine/threonine protein kinase
LSADQPFFLGNYDYGQCLFDGFGVEADFERAADYFGLAAEECGYSSLVYAVCLENGFGVERNIEKAMQYYMAWSWPGCKWGVHMRAFLRCYYWKAEGFGNKPIRDLIVDFGEYREVRELGRGEFGWSTVNEKNGELFCVKHYRVSQEYFPRLIMTMILDTVLRPRHPCLLRYFGWELADAGSEEWRLLSEYHANVSLEQIFEKIRREEGEVDLLLPRELVSEIIICLVCGVRYIHSRDLKHGNLKPSNILFDKDHHPVIGDLCNDGFEEMESLRVKEDKNSRYVSPRLEAMPKDEFRHRTVSRCECDVYSIGAIVYEMVELRGELGICERGRGKSREENDPYPIIGEIIEGCLKPKAKERPTIWAVRRRLKACEYRCYPDVSCEIISRYVSSITSDREKRGAMRRRIAAGNEPF